MQPVKRARRRPNNHNKQSLFIYLERQNCNDVARATWTACLIFSTLGRTRLILGVTCDKNATSYKRPPIIGEVDRSVIVGGLKLVDEVICQSPLVVGEGFLERHKIDIVVHAFCDG